MMMRECRRTTVTIRAFLVLAMLLATAGVALTPATTHAQAGAWAMFGQNLENTASTQADTIRNVGQLDVKWVFATGGEVSGRAAVVADTVYFPDWGGNMWALDARTGALKWTRKFSDYGLPAGTNSDTSPAVSEGVVYMGTQEGAWLLAIDAKTGNLLWRTQLESPANDPFAIVAASPVVVDGMVYAGVASAEVALAGFVPGFPCCRARGSVVAVVAKGANAGQIAWRTYTTPPGYSGVGVEGSNFAVDKSRGTIFVGTGNNYSHPTDPAYLACVAGGGTPAACTSPANHVDSILALDLKTGAIKWAYRAVQWNEQGVSDGTDDWNMACFVPPFSNCPSNPGPAYGFASAPNLITYKTADGSKQTILGAGQKSGIYYALDPDTGALIWRTKVGPGSILGGMAWGSASDGKRIYVSIANFYGIPSSVGSAGSWAALDPATGAIIWQLGDPNAAIALGPVTVSGDAVYVSSMAGGANDPTMLALDATTGQILWSYAAGSSVGAGASIANGVVYWGSGYARLGVPGFTTNNKFYAFSARGR